MTCISVLLHGNLKFFCFGFSISFSTFSLFIVVSDSVNIFRNLFSFFIKIFSIHLDWRNFWCRLSYGSLLPLVSVFTMTPYFLFRLVDSTFSADGWRHLWMDAWPDLPGIKVGQIYLYIPARPLRFRFCPVVITNSFWLSSLRVCLFLSLHYFM